MTHRNRWRRRRDRLAEAQNWRCAYCATDLDIETATIEHAIPLWVCKEFGVDLGTGNLVATCLECNQTHVGEKQIVRFGYLAATMAMALMDGFTKSQGS